MKRFNVSFGEPQAEKLEQEAKSEDISVAELVRRIVYEHYKSGQKERRQ